MFITVCHLKLHDYLFYASREMGRLYETEKYLHNYGLTYALGLVRPPYAHPTQVPRYQEDLQVMNEQGVYVTPAHPLRTTFSFNTFKMANVRYYSFTPQMSTNQVVFGRAKELAPESTFEFFVLSESQQRLPHWIRLGKWMAKARVEVISEGYAEIKQGDYRASGALNPLDLSHPPENCNIVAMAPASLITNAHFTGSYYELKYGEEKNARIVCLPAEMNYQPDHRHRQSA
ncbi:MAG TPA: type I-D CRISPR-associated protein Cas5/Csc1 [Ktedonobacteraceae bacterium]|jgi:CRISPR-associated protein Csc1|nr:type I-D CRISPR-associated protein Cas5/Csc1 [Ktedonobacteraceae bacterium]